jgi:hypothetical protein
MNRPKAKHSLGDKKATSIFENSALSFKKRKCFCLPSPENSSPKGTLEEVLNENCDKRALG